MFFLFLASAGAIRSRYHFINIKGGDYHEEKGKGRVPNKKEEAPIGGASASGSTPNALVFAMDQQKRNGDPWNLKVDEFSRKILLNGPFPRNRKFEFGRKSGLPTVFGILPLTAENRLDNKYLSDDWRPTGLESHDSDCNGHTIFDNRLELKILHDDARRFYPVAQKISTMWNGKYTR